jgi:hypothetical protein
MNQGGCMHHSSPRYFVLFILYFVFVFSPLHAQTTEWRLIWDANSEEDMSHYEVYRSDDQSEPDSLIATVSHNINADSIIYPDDTIKPGVLYKYSVIAVDSNGNKSDHSEPDSAGIPLISGIPGETISMSDQFSIIHLDSLLHDPDHTSNDSTWTAEFNDSVLDVVINSEHEAIISVTNPQWTGTEKVIFKATDPEGFYDTDTVNFTVKNQAFTFTNVSQGKVMPILNDTIVFNEDNTYSVHDSILWYDHIDYGENDKSQLEYRVKGNKNITTTDMGESTLFEPDQDYNGADTLQLIVSDGLSSDSALFVVNVISVNDAPSAFDLLKPEDSFVVDDIESVYFEWESSDDPDGDMLQYMMHVSRQDGVRDTSVSCSENTNYSFNGITFLESGRDYLWWIEVTDGLVTVSSDTLSFQVSQLTYLTGDLQTIPTEFRLHQNFPNPFNPTTTIAFALPRTGHVSILIYNVLGQKMATLVDALKPAGNHRVTFDALDLPNGTYFYMIRCGSFQQIRKMTLRK